MFGQVSQRRYTEIKTVHGQKSRIFSNRAKAKSGGGDALMVPPEDTASFEKHQSKVFFFRLALHEMLGHGCGKLLQETAPGVFNFDHANMPLNPLTKKQVDSWYGVGETPESAFGGIATAYVECLAEGIGLYMMSADGILSTLAPGEDLDVDDIIYNAYMSIACMGLRALRSYDVQNQKWGQVHDHARYGLLRCFMASGLATVDVRSLLSVKVVMDRGKINTAGRPALADLIYRLQICRSVKDVDRGSAIFLDLTAVDEQALAWKQVLEANTRPRTLFVQANTVLADNGDVILKEYPPTKEGLIQSWLDRDGV